MNITQHLQRLLFPREAFQKYPGPDQGLTSGYLCPTSDLLNVWHIAFSPLGIQQPPPASGDHSDFPRTEDGTKINQIWSRDGDTGSMAQKNTTVVAYAAGASLAAITLFYVFGPTFFIDGENAYNTSDGRKRTIIGLSNPANDCFINSVLQAIAGLGDLRLYLIRELHRRALDGPEVFESLPSELKKGEKPGKIISLQKGPVTLALKEMLDALNERPIYKKTITARSLIEALEKAFQTRLSRNQQDAQEFFQIVAERLCDEYHAAEKARKRTGIANGGGPERSLAHMNGTISKINTEDTDLQGSVQTEKLLSKNDGFPFEGKIESQIQCQHCGFKYNPSASSFVSLTLNVPRTSSTTLDHCFDVLLKTEDIDDFKCDRCRLKHALEWKRAKLARSSSEIDQNALENDIGKIEEALRTDPEQPPKNVELPPSDQAPKRKIKRHMRITVFPKIVAIHLSRSVFDPRSYSTKNMAKVAYPERLRLGGILSEKWYKLLGIVCHKGSHNSGHYESFRRNHLYPPFSTPDVFGAYAALSREGSNVASANPSPRIPPRPSSSVFADPPSPDSNRMSLTTSSSNNTSRPESRQIETSHTSSGAKSHTAGGPGSFSTTVNKSPTKSIIRGKRKKSNDRWWRISDDKIKEARTSEVLSMQREVYLLFYELERPGDDAFI